MDPEVAVDQLWGPAATGCCCLTQPLTDAFADALVANLFTGVRPTATTA